MVFNAENFDIFRLGSVPVSYPPKNINTLALLVTPENIGALSLELEGELRYNVEAEPYFKIWASRKSADVEGGSVHLTVYEGDWLVILWNEIRIFRQEEFENTFQVDHVQQPTDNGYLPKDNHLPKSIGDPVIPRGGIPKEKMGRLPERETEIRSPIGELDKEAGNTRGVGN